MKSLVLILGLSLLLQVCGLADEIQLLFPVTRDGQPIVGVPVTVRCFDPETGRQRPPIRLRTDEQGQVNAKIEVASAAERNAASSAGRTPPRDYLMADVPDAPLIVAELNAFRPNAYNRIRQLRVGKAYVLRGIVTRGKDGIANAEVALTNVNGLPLNDPERDVATLQMVGQSGADGKFVLRPLQLEGNTYLQENYSVMASAIATLKSEGKTLRAGLMGHPLEEASQPPHEQAAAHFLLANTWTARGRVVNSLNSQPIPGAQITAKAYSAWTIEPATSNAKGEWELTGIPPQFEFYAVASHPDYGTAWTQVGERYGSLGPAEQEAKVFSGAEMRMRPMTTLRGRIVDEQTAQFPVLVDEKWPTPPTVGALYSEGATGSRYNNFARGITTAPVATDGTFALPVAVGDNTVYPHIAYYEPVERAYSFQVGEKGAGDVVIKVHKSPYFVVRFEAGNPADLAQLSVTDITTNPQGVSYGTNPQAPTYLWATRAKAWGQEMKLRVRYGNGATYETTVTADPKNWPQLVKLPPAAQTGGK